MKLLTNGALLCYDLSLVGHVSKAAIGSFYMALPAFKYTVLRNCQGSGMYNFLNYFMTPLSESSIYSSRKSGGEKMAQHNINH